MYVCVCHAVTDRDIESVAAQGCASVRQLREHFGLGSSCGRCVKCARDTLTRALALGSASADESSDLVVL